MFLFLFYAYLVEIECDKSLNSGNQELHCKIWKEQQQKEAKEKSSGSVDIIGTTGALVRTW